MNGTLDRIPIYLLNNIDLDTVKLFIEKLEGWDYSNTSKTCQAGIQFLKNKLKMRLKTLTQNIYIKITI